MTSAIPASVAGTRRRTGIGFLMFVTIAIAIATAAVAFFPWTVGYGLYHGYLPLKARIAGHDSDLPSKASRCANCHDAIRNDRSSASVIAPLTKASLTVANSRRGGPPTTYGEESFCSLLHNGVDPALVIVNRTMPRFDLTSSDCHALWKFVSSR